MQTTFRRVQPPGLLIPVASTALIVAAVFVQGPGLLAILVLAAVFVPLEWLFSFQRGGLKRSALVTDVMHAIVSVTLGLVIVEVFVLLAAGPIETVSPLDVAHSVPAVPAAVLAFVVTSFAMYWSHRLEHSVPLLWRVHAVHHSSEHLYFLSTTRAHPLDQALTQTAATLPLLFLGYGKVAFGLVYLVVVQLQDYYAHSNVRGRLPVLRWVILTPQYHHWHHAHFAEGRGRNFGHPMLDWLFGTVHLPRRERAQEFGVREVVPEGYFGQLAYPFRRRTVNPAEVATGSLTSAR